MMRKQKLTLIKLMMHICLVMLATAIFSKAARASGEGTRHITGSGVNVYFMNDKVFGAVNGQPVWAIYNCGSDINGEIDIRGEFHTFEFVYHQKGDRVITGKFGPRSDMRCMRDV